MTPSPDRVVTRRARRGWRPVVRVLGVVLVLTSAAVLAVGLWPTGTSGDGATAAAADPAIASAASSGREGWRLVWADEFDGTDVDPTRWDPEHLSTYGEGNLELACLMDRPENLAVADGILRITARREPVPLSCGNDPRFPDGRDYTSAHLVTRDLASWTYGRFEVRAQLPTQADTSKGLWPAFWLRPQSGSLGELDVLEALGGGPGDREWDRVHHTIWYDYSGRHPQQSATAVLPDGGRPSEGMHTYAAEWEPGEIRWYVDDVLTFRRDTTTTPWLIEAFSAPMYLRLNLAVGGRWPGSPTEDTAFPAVFAVDHVRVYQR